MKHIWTDKPPKHSDANTRTSERRPVSVPARLTWKDQRGATRFATVVTRNVSEIGVYVESTTPLSIPLFRLVQLQIERDARDGGALPETLQAGAHSLGRLPRDAADVDQRRRGWRSG